MAEPYWTMEGPHKNSALSDAHIWMLTSLPKKIISDPHESCISQDLRTREKSV